MLVDYVIVAAGAYLLGSIPFGYILVRLFRGEDVRASGSGNIGATNVARKSPALGIVTLLLDAGKGFAAVMLGRALAGGDVLPGSSGQPAFITVAPAVAALCAIVGHVFPVWLKFRGGKGVATGVGAFIGLAPRAVLVALVIFLVIVLAFRYVSLGSIVAAATFPVAAYLLNEYGQSATVLVLASTGAAIIILKHHQNIRRLLAGTEHRLGAKA